MGRRITIDPLTRLEGEGKVVILLDERGGVERAFFQTTDLRGFEKFCVGRPAEDLPMLTAKIAASVPRPITSLPPKPWMTSIRWSLRRRPGRSGN